MSGKLSRVSPRKVAANRQNALKSTGPKTTQGKAYSRRNALKHGLFAMDLYMAAITKWEDPGEYQELKDRLTEDLQPVGAAEELEVQHIAVCWWKRSRTWRYENAEIAIQLCVRHTKLVDIQTPSSEDQARLVLLKTAESEIETTGELSDELRQKMFADARVQQLWELNEQDLNESLARRIGLLPSTTKEVVEASPVSRKTFLLGIVRRAALALVNEGVWLTAEAEKLANDLEAIPRPEALDRVLRAEAANDKSLSRAMDRLERLQRRRKGEPARVP